jgi:hypothetical protein
MKKGKKTTKKGKKNGAKENEIYPGQATCKEMENGRRLVGTGWEKEGLVSKQKKIASPTKTKILRVDLRACPRPRRHRVAMTKLWCKSKLPPGLPSRGVLANTATHGMGTRPECKV